MMRNKFKNFFFSSYLPITTTTTTTITKVFKTTKIKIKIFCVAFIVHFSIINYQHYYSFPDRV